MTLLLRIQNVDDSAMIKRQTNDKSNIKLSSSLKIPDDPDISHPEQSSPRLDRISVTLVYVMLITMRSRRGYYLA